MRPLLRRLFLAGLACLSTCAKAQEALRMSLAGQEAVEARKRAAATGHYNLKLGPVKMRFQSGLGLELNDNVNLSEDDPQADLILRPRLTTHTSWQVTDQNQLALAFAIGYAKYLNRTELDHVFITPGSALSFDVFVKDFVINFHDRFSMTQEAYEQPTLSRTGDFGRIQNTSGVNVDWDLNKLILSLGYDHDLYLSTSPQFDYLNRSSELFSARAAFILNPTTQAGLEVGGGLTDYDQNVLSDLTHVSAGPFLRWKVSDYLNLRLTVGYVAYFLESGGTLGDEREVSAVYGDLTLAHRIHPKVSYSLSAGRQIQFGLVSHTVDLFYARLTADWRFFRKVSLRTPVFYERAEESLRIAEQADRYGGGIGAGYRITQKLASTASYQFIIKDSDLPRRDYVQNRLVFDLTYSF